MKNSLRSPETLIFGGSFNPPTVAHQAIVEACQDNSPHSEIWIMPSGNRYDKQIEMPTEHRLGMIRAMINSLPDKENVELCAMEINLPEISQTRDTVRKLNDIYPDRNFRFVFGADAYLSMPAWNGGTDLRESLPMLLVPRIGRLPLIESGDVKILPTVVPEVSSTEVRQKIQAFDTIDGLVCRGVQMYIEDHRLYIPRTGVA